ncbi:hypothetical protein FEM03_12995 [Phragmitibacter flavus]|uniref:Uncharacterized protein n=1 Tax=Phragmitibacter flavus TaxID=2576071 RepID=A0A5R8KCS4_9BACT|nr:hypothetical protein [Phragmitibacter flavus]TLD70110.1 hypothetical protein FEM03_12995 [Phragmitibacter flavus]
MPRPLLFLAALLLSAAANLPAQDPSKSSFTTKSYPFKSDELTNGFILPNKGQLRAPGLPDTPNAKPADITKFLGLSHAVLAEYLLPQGVHLPEGSLIAYNPANSTLTARTTAEVHAQLSTLSEQSLTTVPNILRFRLHLLEADETSVRTLLSKTRLPHDHTQAYQEFLATPNTKEIDLLTIDSRSGQRSISNQITDFIYNAEFTATQSGLPLTTGNHVEQVGTTLEIDPVLGPDGRTLDINYQLNHHYAPPQQRWEPIAINGEKRQEVRLTNFFKANNSTSIMMFSGTTRLLSAWKPQDINFLEGRLQTAFLRADVVKILPDTDPQIETWFGKEGKDLKPKALPKPGEDPLLPPGMMMRTFRVPPDFFSVLRGQNSNDHAPADPFAPAAASSEPQMTIRATALEILRAQGFEFPKGSSANFNPATGELIVRNTQENLEELEAHIGSIRIRRPQQLVFTLHLISGDATYLRDITTSGIALANHQKIFETIQAAANTNPAPHQLKWLHSTRLQCRSGQRAVLKTGPIHQFVDQVSETKPAPTANSKEGDKAVPPAQAAVADALRDFYAVTDQREAGLEFEIDPVLGPDGETIDINLSLENHFRAPTLLLSEADALHLDAPQTHFHTYQNNTSVTLIKGSTRLLGLWLPKGANSAEDPAQAHAAFLQVDLMTLE